MEDGDQDSDPGRGFSGISGERGDIGEVAGTGGAEVLKALAGNCPLSKGAAERPAGANR